MKQLPGFVSCDFDRLRVISWFVLSYVGAGPLIVPDHGGSDCLGEGGGSVWVSNGADRIAPSTRQKLSVSGNVRLQVGQLFILEEPLFSPGLRGCCLKDSC